MRLFSFYLEGLAWKDEDIFEGHNSNVSFLPLHHSLKIDGTKSADVFKHVL